jgi:flagellar motility protein MotE (MotC chaperone)
MANPLDLLSRIRFLPVTIFAASLMLTVKVGDIWQGVDGIRHGGPLAIAAAGAQQSPGTEPPGQPAQPTQPAPEPAKPPEPKPAGEAKAAEQPPPPVDDPVARSLTTRDPSLMTAQEIDLLQQLSERREALETRARELDVRASLLKAAEARIDKKIVELKGFQDTIERLIKSYDKQQEDKLLSLVKIYENMKPKDAATVFEGLDMDTLLAIVERMKEKKLAEVMGKMNPNKASEVTTELMRLRQMPRPGTGIPGG